MGLAPHFPACEKANISGQDLPVCSSLIVSSRVFLLTGSRASWFTIFGVSHLSMCFVFGADGVRCCADGVSRAAYLQDSC